MVDSLNDTDGLFTDGFFAYAYLNGPFMVMTYDNDGWGLNRMNFVFAHETGHIFGAADEYASSGCTPSNITGYLGIANASCNNGGVTTDISIMGTAAEQENPSVDVSTSARHAIGWRNPTAGTGVGSVVDVVRTSTVSLTQHAPDPTTDTTPTFSAVAGNTAWPPASGHSPVTISRVSSAEWNVDGGSFTPAGVGANDGTFNGESEAYTFTPQSVVGAGTHTFSTRAINRFGHTSTAASDTLTIQGGGTTPANNNFGSAVTVASLPAHFELSNSGATTEASEPTSLVGCLTGSGSHPIGSTVWYRFTPSSAMTVTVTLAGSNFDTALEVYTGSVLSGLTRVVCDDDAVAPGGASRVEFTAAAGTTYQIQVGGWNGQTGNLVVDITGIAAPNSADLSVGITDNPDPAVQGQTIQYGIQITNNGPDAASPVTSTTTLNGLGPFSADCPGNMSSSESTLTCVIANMNSGATVSFTIFATVLIPGRVANTTTVSAPQPDPSLASNTRTVTTAVSCANPRPRISLQTAPNGDGRLRVTITAGAGALSSIEIGDAVQKPSVPTNASITVVSPGGGPNGLTGAYTYSPPPNTTTVTLLISRVGVGSTIVPMVITDGCGAWRTFVGGGATAF